MPPTISICCAVAPRNEKYPAPKKVAKKGAIVSHLQKIDLNGGEKHMINRTRAYEKFLTLLNQIDNSNMSLDEQKELLDEMKSDIEFKLQQVYADKNEW